jgi:hypothetical protein
MCTETAYMFQLAVKPTILRYLRVWKTSNPEPTSDNLRLAYSSTRSRLVVGSVTLSLIYSASLLQTWSKFAQAVAHMTCTPKLHNSNLGRNIDCPDIDLVVFLSFSLPRVIMGYFLELGYALLLPNFIEFTVEPILVWFTGSVVK